MKQIIEDFLNIPFVQRVILGVSIISLILLFNKYIFSFLSLPWGIAYLIISSMNGQFDQAIFSDIFNVNNVNEKIRIMNLLILGVIYVGGLKILGIIIDFGNLDQRNLKRELKFSMLFVGFFLFLSWIILKISNPSLIISIINILPVIIFLIYKLIKPKIILKTLKYDNLFILLIGFISIIGFISGKEINNQSIFQGVLPTKGYVLLNNENTSLIELHNKLQLPESYKRNEIELIKKIFYANENYEGRILAGFCILWESETKYYVSTYFGGDKCYKNQGIEPIILEKNNGFIIRYLKNASFKNMVDSPYSKLLTLQTGYDTENIESIFYDYITGLYYSKLDSNYNFDVSEIFRDVYNDKGILKLDKLYVNYLETFLMNGDIDFTRENNSELKKRDELVRYFFEGENKNLEEYFIIIEDFNALIYEYFEKNKYDDAYFKSEISNLFNTIQEIKVTGKKDKFLILNQPDLINIKYVSDLKYIKFFKNKFDFNNDITEETKLQDTFEEGCIEILNDYNLIYHYENVGIKYNISKITDNWYDYNYSIDFKGSSLAPGSCYTNSYTFDF